jgi:NAD(P)-dependent dehydrogenase (short-subunit alcohol dehydrogenase family)
MDFTGKVALVTGAGQHIGLTTARLLATLGAAVAINDLRSERAHQAAEQLEQAGHRAIAVPADVRDRAAVEQMVQRTVDAFGRLDIVVNSAGEGSFAPVLEMEESAWDLELDTNLKGTFLVCQAAARAMVAQGRGGAIVCLASTAAESARMNGISHCAAKAGVVMVVKVMALELGQHGIRVNAVAPGLVPGPDQVSNQVYREAFVKFVPLGRLGHADDIARGIAFLASDDAAWITGEVLHVDGGFLAGRPLPRNVGPATPS